MSARPADRIESGEEIFDLTPLIDVVFILLIFFLVATTLQVREEQIPIRLPESAGGEAAREEPLFVISVQADGALFVGQEQIAREALAARLREQKVKSVLLRGDAATALGQAVGVIDLCSEAGVEQVTLGTVPERGP